MKKGRSLLLAVIMLLGSIVVVGMADVGRVSADPSTPLIYIFPASQPGPISAGTLLGVQVRINSSTGRGAPHETHEPAVATDKTFAWEVNVTFNPSVVQVNSSYIAIRHPTYDWFNCFHKWLYDPIFMTWTDLGSYATSEAKSYDNTTGWVSYWCALNEDPTTLALPSPKTFPNAGLHAGTYYDLPYTDGISTSTLASPPGSWPGDWFMLFAIYFTVMVDIPTPPTQGGSWIEIESARLWMYDGVTLYPADTADGSIGQPAEIPEFPLGIEILTILAPVILIVYLWRRKGWKK